MEDLANVKGLRELAKFLDQLPFKVQNNIMRGALRAGMNEVQPVAKGLVHDVTGFLSAGLKVGTRMSSTRVFSTLRATGPHARIAHLVEFGTRPHNISAKPSAWLFFKNMFAKTVSHPGAKPKPFMRPALDTMAQPALIATGEYVKRRITKEGIDASHIMVEGDR